MKTRSFWLVAILFFAFTLAGSAQSYNGYLDATGCGYIQGWAWDAKQPNTPIFVDIYDGSTPAAGNVAANLNGICACQAS